MHVSKSAIRNIKGRLGLGETRKGVTWAARKSKPKRNKYGSPRFTTERLNRAMKSAWGNQRNADYLFDEYKRKMNNLLFNGKIYYQLSLFHAGDKDSDHFLTTDLAGFFNDLQQQKGKYSETDARRIFRVHFITRDRFDEDHDVRP